MEYVETPPRSALSGWVRCYWMLRRAGGKPAPAVTFERVFPDGLAAAAVRCGYTDQAHLTRAFRDFAGITPAVFLGNDHRLSRLFAGLAGS